MIIDRHGFPTAEIHDFRPLIDVCICGNRIFNFVTAHGLMLDECRMCGTFHQRAVISMAAKIEAYYDHGYHQDTQRHPGVKPYADRYPQDMHAARARLVRYAALMTKSGSIDELAVLNWLDVGAGNCAFVDLLVEMGAHAIGIDPDPVYGQNRTPEYVKKGRLRDVDVGRKFGAITYHDVLEHLVDPLEELRQAWARVGSDSFLVLEVPDVTHPDGYKHFKAEHLWHFTLVGLDWTRLALRPSPKLVSAYNPIPGKQTVIWRKPS